jgi:hypothetical protein
MIKRPKTNDGYHLVYAIREDDGEFSYFIAKEFMNRWISDNGDDLIRVQPIEKLYK